MFILETGRLIVRELDCATDAEFIFTLLNTPKFLQFIGDRGVRTVEQASDFIENRYRQSYRDHGFGLYVVEQKDVKMPIGLCGFIRRDTLTSPDLGFAFLPEFEGKGYGYESAKAVLGHGCDELGFRHVAAITSLDNQVSGRLLEKLGFVFVRVTPMPGGDVKLYNIDLFD